MMSKGISGHISKHIKCFLNAEDVSSISLQFVHKDYVGDNLKLSMATLPREELLLLAKMANHPL